MIEFNNESYGGTEIISREVLTKIPKKFLNKFQIICNENIKLDYSKIRLFWFHDTPKQKSNFHIQNEGWKKFHKLIFISHHQMEEYVREYNIPYSHCAVIKYAIDPIKIQSKKSNKISLIYTSTPHRGLDILVNVFEKLCEEYNNLNLKVYSSYSIYGREKNQKEYEKSFLYERLNSHPKIENFGFVSNEEIKKSLASSHIFAYPSTYRETFCLSLLEAMSAGCLCVHPNYGCLPETAANWTMMYDYHEDKKIHSAIFHHYLKKAIYLINQKNTQKKLKYQRNYVNYFYNWKIRIQEWIELLQSLEYSYSQSSKNNYITYS